MHTESNTSKTRMFNRRGMIAGGAGMAAALMIGRKASARQDPDSGPTPGDVAVLKFLAAAELIEDDLWQQYCELAVANRDFNRALRTIDPSLVRYICDDRDDERSHANLINGFLAAIGEEPVNLDAFRTLPSVNAPGANRIGRLTNLTRLNVDTSWFLRYRGAGNPDFDDNFPQLVRIVGRPTVPTSGRLSPREMQAVAHSAAFHFCAIEQGGGSLYTNLISRVRSREALMILASIGPTEVYHFAAFHKSLEGLFALDAGGGLVFPNLRGMPDLAQAIFPEPCTFLDSELPLCSVIRPSSSRQAGALAAATGLIDSGLFDGQPPEFFQAVAALASAADQANS
jgi:hypothetical protein